MITLNMSLLSVFSNHMHPLGPNQSVLTISNTEHLLCGTGWARGKATWREAAIPGPKHRDRAGGT